VVYSGSMRTQDYAALFAEAMKAGQNRDYAKAVELLARIVGSTDRFPQALLYLGRSYHALGDFSRAAQTLNFYIRGRPESVAGRFFLGRAYIALDQFPQAIRHLRKALDLDPAFSPAYGLLGLAYLKAKRPDKAIWQFAKALEIDPQNRRLQVGYLNTALVLAIRLFYRGELLDAARLFTEVLEQRRASILPHLYLASIYRELGKDSLALSHMDAAATISPEDPFLPLQKALILLSQGKKAAAAEEIKAGVRLLKTGVSPASTPEDVLRFITVNLFKERRYRETVFYAAKLLRGAYNDPQLHALVGEAYRNLGDLTKAKNHYLRAIEKDRGSRELRYGLLSVLWEREEWGELLAQAARLIQKDRSDGPGRYFHSLALSRTGAAVEQVLAELQQQVRAHGPDPVLMAELGAAYVRAGMPELAEGWYLRAMKRGSDDPATLLALAGIYEGLGRRDRQADAISRYLELRPFDRAARRGYLRILLELESFPDAAEQIALLLPMEPDNEKLKSTLAVCYRRTGRYADALVLLKDLLARSPRSQEHMKAAIYCLDRMGARAVAIRALESFIQHQGESLSLTLMLGVLRFQDGAHAKAAEIFRKAVSMAPRDWRANRNLGMVYRAMGNNEFSEKFLAKAAQCLAEAEAASSAKPGRG
jgi:tetratricopeptide (TPR) repeat protein